MRPGPRTRACRVTSETTGRCNRSSADGYAAALARRMRARKIAGATAIAVAPSARAATPSTSSATPPSNASAAAVSPESRSQSRGAFRAPQAVSRRRVARWPRRTTGSSRCRGRRGEARSFGTLVGPGQPGAGDRHHEEAAGQRGAAPDLVDQRADHEHQRVHPEHMRADDREDRLLRVVVVVDDDEAGQVHHGDHHAEARDRGQHRRDHARTSQDLPERRRFGGRACRPLGAIRSAITFVSGRTRQREPAGDERQAGRGEPRHGQRVGGDVLACEQRPEERRAQHRAEDRAEEDVRDAARSAFGRIHVARGSSDQERHRSGDPSEREACDERDSRAPVRSRRQRGCSRSSRGGNRRRSRGRAEAVHRAPGWEGGQRRGRQEDRRAGPSSDRNPVTRTNEQGQHRGAELQDCRVERLDDGQGRGVPRDGRCCSDKRGQPCSELLSAAVRGVPDSGRAERGLRDPAHRDDSATRGEELEERTGRLDLVGPWATVGGRLAGPVRVRGDDVPEQHVLLEAELVEHAVDDRRRRLRGPASRQLALGGERDAADPRAAVARPPRRRGGARLPSAARGSPPAGGGAARSPRTGCTSSRSARPRGAGSKRVRAHRRREENHELRHGHPQQDDQRRSEREADQPQGGERKDVEDRGEPPRDARSFPQPPENRAVHDEREHRLRNARVVQLGGDRREPGTSVPSAARRGESAASLARSARRQDNPASCGVSPSSSCSSRSPSACPRRSQAARATPGSRPTRSCSARRSR